MIFDHLEHQQENHNENFNKKVDYFEIVVFKHIFAQSAAEYTDCISAES